MAQTVNLRKMNRSRLRNNFLRLKWISPHTVKSQTAYTDILLHLQCIYHGFCKLTVLPAKCKRRPSIFILNIATIQLKVSRVLSSNLASFHRQKWLELPSTGLHFKWPQLVKGQRLHLGLPYGWGDSDAWSHLQGLPWSELAGSWAGEPELEKKKAGHSHTSPPES